MRDYIKFGCKECGSPHVREKNGKLHCVSCGTWFEKNVETDEERDARVLYLTRLDRAEEFLRMSPPRFDDAEDHFKDFIRFYPNYSDGYWGLVRARYGIKYEVDTNGKTLPCCYKSSYEDFRKDSDFKRALSCAENDKIYGNLKEQAELIAGICEEWRKEAGKYNYDIFISFKGKNEELKISDEDQREMNDLYDFLKDEGYSVFFSPRSMHKHTGMYYDAYIFSALQSAKVMIVYGSKPEYFTSTWVQNEWTRFLRMVDNGEKKNGSCIVVYNGFNPYELPHDLRRIQAVDASQRRFYINILNCVKKILSEEKKVHGFVKSICSYCKSPSLVERADGKLQCTSCGAVIEKYGWDFNSIPVEINKDSAEKNDDKYSWHKVDFVPDMSLRPDYELKVDSDFYIVNSSLLNYRGNKTEVVIPDNITHISSWAFCDCSEITNVVIPKSVTSIGKSAFSKCYNLSSIVIPDSVTSIGESAFYSCSSLSGIVIPNSVTSIGEEAFRGCSNLSDIVIPDSVTYVGRCAFYNCPMLSIWVDNIDQVKKWSDYWNPHNRPVRVKEAAKRLEVDSDFEIVEGCLVGYKGIKTNVVIPYGVTSIGAKAFYDCVDIVNLVIPNGVTSIGAKAFYGCYRLSEVSIPNGVTSIGDEAFCNCTNLAKVSLPDSVTSIGKSAFSHCSYLTGVVIGNGVDSIGEYAFEGCYRLSVITVGKNNENYKSIDGNLYTKDEKTLVQYAAGKKDESFKIPQGVVMIGPSAFGYCKNLVNVTIPNSVNTIGSYAFNNCEKITYVNLPYSVTKIEWMAFCECTKLSSIIIPSGVTYVGANAFYNCKNLKSATFLSSKGWYAGYNSPVPIPFLNNKAMAAKYLTSKIGNQSWYKK